MKSGRQGRALSCLSTVGCLYSGIEIQWFFLMNQFIKMGHFNSSNSKMIKPWLRSSALQLKKKNYTEKHVENLSAQNRHVQSECSKTTGSCGRHGAPLLRTGDEQLIAPVTPREMTAVIRKCGEAEKWETKKLWSVLATQSSSWPDRCQSFITAN